MRTTSVLLAVIFLFSLFCGCRKDDQKPVPTKGLRGKIIVSSCVTTAVQVLNKDIGADWTDCRDQKEYQHVIDVVIKNLQTWPIEGEFSFDIVPNEPHFRCLAVDYCGPAPSEFYTIAIIQD